MKEDKDRISYRKDLESGVLDKYKGKYVAYLGGKLVMKGVEIFYADSEREMISELQNYRGSFTIQRVMASREEALAGKSVLERRSLRSPRRSRK